LAAGVGEYEPIGHSLQKDEPRSSENVPLGQAVQELDAAPSTADAVPLGQGVQVASLVAPVADENLPAGHD
jgi:hypothetical protein